VRIPSMIMLLLTLSVSAAGTARAAGNDDPAFIAFSAAYFDVNKQDDTAGELRIEYRSNKRYWIFKPFGGVMATSDAAFHAFAGVGIDLYFGRRFVITPSFAPGVYFRGSGKDLGYPLEFRSQLEFAWRFDDRSRLGISINHISNASIGDRNPGVESLAITYSLPFSAIFGN